MSRLLLKAAASLAVVTLPQLAAPTYAQAPAQPEATAPNPVDAKAVRAMDRMAAYLRTLRSFEIDISSTIETALDDGQKLQFGGTSKYVVTRPNKLFLDLSTDRIHRQFYYDGTTVVMYAPRMNVYTRVDAPDTIGKMFDRAFDKYGISLPLIDLFSWGADAENTHTPLSAMVVGYAKLSGVDTDHYAFREEGVDYQLWIQRGDKPLPLKMVITDADDPDHPQYVANIKWNLSPAIAADAFTFNPPTGASQIKAVEVDEVKEAVQ